MTLIIDNLQSEGLIEFKTKRALTNAVVVANSTQTLTATSEHLQAYTGSVAGQIVKLPDATTLSVGYQYYLLNDASVAVSVQNNASGALFVLYPAERALIVCLGTGTAAGTWSYSKLQSAPQGTQFYTTYPGTGLVVNYLGGNVRFNGVLTAVAGGAITLPASTSGSIYVDIDAVVKATASIPSGAVPLYNFTTSASAVTSLVDVREELENNLVWGVTDDITGFISGQAKAGGSSEKYARADHSHGNSLPLMRAGVVTGGTFAGNPKKATVTFTTPLASTAYAITISGIDARTFTYESKTTGGFVINSNANTALANEVSWQAIASGESA